MDRLAQLKRMEKMSALRAAAPPGSIIIEERPTTPVQPTRLQAYEAREPRFSNDEYQGLLKCGKSAFDDRLREVQGEINLRDLFCIPTPSRLIEMCAFRAPEPSYMVVAKDGLYVKSSSTEVIIGSPRDRRKFNWFAGTFESQHKPMQLFSLRSSYSFINHRQWCERLSELDNHITVFFATGRNNSKIACIYLRPCEQAEITVLYSHPNAVDIGLNAATLWALGKQLGVNVLSYDYSGYGLSNGRASESNANANIIDVLQAFNNLYPRVKDSDIILYGESIGTVPTIHLASIRDSFAGIVLHGCLASALRTVCPRKRICACFDIFANVDKASRFKTPTLMIHGVHDEVIPFKTAMAVYDKLQNPVEPLFVPDATHNEVSGTPEYFERLQKFIKSEIRAA